MRHGKISFNLVIGVTYFAVFSNQALAKRIESTDIKPIVDKPKSEQNAWIFSQQTDSLKTYTVCVSNDAIKFVCGNLFILARQPDWQIKLVNERAKTYWEMPLKDFTGLKSVESFGISKLEKTNSSPGPNNLVANQAVIKQEGKSDPKANELKLGLRPAKVTVWSTSSINVPQGALSVLSRLYGLEGIKGIPLRIQITNDRAEKPECLSTQWCLERDVPTDFFDIPKPFKRGPNRNEVEMQETVTTLRSQLKKTRFQKTTEKNSQNPHQEKAQVPATSTSPPKK